MYGQSYNHLNKKLNYYKSENGNLKADYPANDGGHAYENAELGDEIIASVDNKPVTLNDIYFLGNFRRILYGSKKTFDDKFSDKKIVKLLNIYINRFLILKEEHKIDIININKVYLNSYIKKFMQDYKRKYKSLKLSHFLAIFGYNYVKFENFMEDMLIERGFIIEHLKLFFNISKKNAIILKRLENKKNFENNFNKSKEIPIKHLSGRNIISDLKAWVRKLRNKAKIDIISSKY
ncbi:MAG: hypothetical protein EVJ46_01715 [Candidatus Acididesulfobacter guangdongensis]|uniref:Uncharacterized protein n=1 Tax=Acididesulfobacter guangdongensis TaxID=2597225 RepID=A0A519BI74_ACIG2|nr:MAG: hypothetical protein EVJ46_01715 [Candidatus Acididesulfobacter guangdongensis]